MNQSNDTVRKNLLYFNPYFNTVVPGIEIELPDNISLNEYLLNLGKEGFNIPPKLVNNISQYELDHLMMFLHTHNKKFISLCFIENVNNFYYFDRKALHA